MNITITSKVEKSARRVPLVPVVALGAIGLLLAFTDVRQGLGLMLAGIPVGALVWVGMRAMVKVYGDMVWELSPAGIGLRSGGEAERLVAWDAIAAVKLGGAGATIILKQDQEELRLAFIADQEAAMIRDCWRQPQLLGEDDDVEAPPPEVPSTARKLGRIVLAAALLAAGIAGIIFGAATLQQHLASRNWPTVEGTVLEAQYGYTPPRLGSGEMCQALVKYKYVVDGTTYESTRATTWSDDLSGEFDQAKALVDSLTVGRAVTVYYDPANPAYAVLQRGVHTLDSTLVLIAGTALAAIGLHLIRRLFRRPIRTTRASLQQYAQPQTA